MRRIRWCLLLSIAILMTGCSGGVSGLSPIEKVEKMLVEMTNYEAEAQMTFTKNKKSSTIKVKQIYEVEGPYELTILEPDHVKGYKTCFDGEKITEYNPATDKSVQVQVSPVKNQVLFGTFVHNYLESGSKKTPEETEQDTVVVETAIPGNYKYMAHEKAWFNKETGMPIKVEIYGQDGALTISIEFSTFKYNVETK